MEISIQGEVNSWFACAWTGMDDLRVVRIKSRVKSLHIGCFSFFRSLNLERRSCKHRFHR